jgi:serine/threonine protein kinase
VLVLAAGAAAALGAIHEAGIVHRDLKPSNVLLAPDGPVVIDFGIARATESTPLTRTGLRIGSPQFMSPEQALGDPAGPASDVFALGSLIFFAATGRAPFGDGPDTAVLYRIVHEEPRLDGCPEQFQTLVTRCLAKDPVGRPSIEEFIRAVTPEAKSGPLDAAVSGTGTKIWLPPALTKILPMYEARQPATSPGAPPRQAQQRYRCRICGTMARSPDAVC